MLVDKWRSVDLNPGGHDYISSIVYWIIPSYKKMKIDELDHKVLLKWMESLKYNLRDKDKIFP